MAYIVADYYAPLTVAPTGSTEYIYATATHISYSASGAQFTGNGNSSYFGVGQTLQLPVSTPASGVFVHIIKATVGQQTPGGSNGKITFSRAVDAYTNLGTIGTYQSTTSVFSLTTENSSSLQPNIPNNPPTEHIIAMRFNYTSGVVEAWMDGVKCPNTYTNTGFTQPCFGNPVFLGGAKTTSYVERTFLGTLRDFAQVNHALTDEEMTGITAQTIPYGPRGIISVTPNTGTRGDQTTLTVAGLFDRPVYTGYEPCTNSANLVGTATLAADGKIGNAVKTLDYNSSIQCPNWTSQGSFSVAFWYKMRYSDPAKYTVAWWIGSNQVAPYNYQYRMISFINKEIYVVISKQASYTYKGLYTSLRDSSGAYIEYGEWVHIALTLSNSSSSNMPILYVNGKSTSYTTQSNGSFTDYAVGAGNSTTGQYAHRLGGMFSPVYAPSWTSFEQACDGVCDYYWYNGIWTQADVTKLANIPVITLDDTNVTPPRFPDYNTAVITVP